MLGTWAIGLATRSTDVHAGPYGEDAESCMLRADGKIYFNGVVVGALVEPVVEGDVVVRSVHWRISFIVK